MKKLDLDNLNYDKVLFCERKGKYVDQMNITKKDGKRFIWIKHVMDRQGGETNKYHIYSKEEITDGMEFRPRKDAIGDLYYIKLNRNEVVEMLGKKAADF